MELRVLELFSGIGGMHYAFQYAQLKGKFVGVMDINTVANAVYAHNYKNVKVRTKNIQSLSEKEIEKLDVNMILMSPPCQPHTRQGLQRDIEDKRSDALAHICRLLPLCKTLRYVLMENVKGFEGSQAHEQFIGALEKAGFYWREFILTPTQFNVPNTRHRYYCIARKNNDFSFQGGQIWDEIPLPMTTNHPMPTISTILDPEASSELVLPDDVLLKRVPVMDIVNPTDTKSMCFTKAYTHYSEGTGSVFTPLSGEEFKRIFKAANELETTLISDCNSADLQQSRLALLRQLKLRYFTPREVARLMSFPEYFEFPNDTTLRQKYRLLGNSINVRVVGVLLKVLTDCEKQ
ncbi:tRNA (cytosine(38)-C(5))-methyltransferase [Scaptodrosophila lebanonensis]|uniref:tRNA (cytosine(38)-C(5))-methyltransferase n=1 Tax=Drosophila lebanonensis TaxID=7225 RepID=A0A6J2U9U8_DROLE|nr:tRNA (cytosine(38)-C(5))-methyltransferase [Scaptodrosophila lebanonensis]